MFKEGHCSTKNREGRNDSKSEEGTQDITESHCIEMKFCFTCFVHLFVLCRDFPGGSVVKALPSHVGGVV